MLGRERSPVAQSDILCVESEFDPGIDAFRRNGFLANSNKSDAAKDICSAVFQANEDGNFFLQLVREQAAR